MDISAIAEQVMGALGGAPEKIQELMADPQGVIEQVTGYTLEEGQVGEVVEIIKTQIAEGAANFDLGTIGDQLGGLFGEGSPLGNIGDVLGGLFGKK